MTHGHVDLATESFEEFPSQAYEYAYEHGWTDGLPIIPATADSVQKFVAASGREGDEVIAILPPRNGRVTIETIAVNAVMAGCRAEYMPVIIAALEGLTDPAFPLEHMQVTTGTSTPFLLVNGPVRKKLDINYGYGCLGPGWRANSTIGRAVRLILYNGGGALPGVYNKSSFASPLRYSYMCGENEEGNPWTPFHLDRGFERGQSTVTVFDAVSYSQIGSSKSVGADETLRQIATHMLPMHGSFGDSALLLLSINTARLLHDAGLGKADVQQRLWELARFPISFFAKTLVAEQRVAGRGDENTIWRCARPEKFYVAVAGGAGPYDVYITAVSPQTRLIRGM